MNNESLSQQASISTPPVPPAQPAKRLWLLAVIVIAIGIGVLFTVTKLMSVPPGPTVQVVETPEASPTRPIRTLSAIATQSAFIALRETHASFSANLTSTNLDDPSLSPPVLDLPLGLRQ